MNASFAYIPEKVIYEQQETVELPYFELTVKIDGQNAPFPLYSQQTIVGEKVELVLVSGYSQISKHDKLRILIGKWGKYETHLTDELIAVKDELPGLLKQIIQWFEKPEAPDLLTGEPYRPKITVHYRFHDRMVTKKTIEKKIPAFVFFTCPVALSCKSIKVGCLRYKVDAPSYWDDRYWNFGSMGWIRVPESVPLNAEQIETAFKELAAEMLKCKFDPTIWKYKETTQICLE